MTEKIIAKTARMSEAELSARQADVRHAIGEAHAKIRALQEQVLRLTQEDDTLKDELTARTLMAAGDSPDWAYLLQSNQGNLHYRALYSALTARGLDTLLTNLETAQHRVSVWLPEERPRAVEDIAKALQDIVPAIKPLADGWCYVDIYYAEGMSDGSLGGGTALRFTPDLSQFEVAQEAFGRHTPVHSGATLLDCLAKLR